MKLIKPILVQCNKCNNVKEVDAYLELIDSEERQMGSEDFYSSEIEDECPNCGNYEKIILNVWEYPMGAINNQEEKYEGVNIIETPEYDPSENDDF